ncbi:site-specific DNA-methyltransferase [Aromatoleum bremense]|uniref:site-specific DNA-methyltransferase (adenine-specific) n=1 Tax=Aromatoleum bremense TaxID=76115 RepID=A0ABX1NZ82_9RHOO|nr:site-specific DNA-methyltransferase [Aromatoleum bremense]NMG16805.1 site-specific DNA-methyltransferase [Aromatoleum bremense]QTQ33847.1 DNA methylase N-4/N-6 domain-containing protein [Aromatoleum bremense]
MAKQNNKSAPLTVDTLTHDDATRRNIPTAEYQSVMQKDERSAVRVAYERRNRDLDPQLVWRGKDQQDWSDLVVNAPPLYIQEKVHPKALIDDLRRQSERRSEYADAQPDLFADFNGLPDDNAKTEFYRHDGHWSNRMILGDSLQVMASLAEREGLRGKVQCIYFDPPYGIKFNSNFQWSTTSRDVKDGNAEHITREPEQVKAFRDTWRDGIHSYLTYLRDRLTVARDLLTESGSIFVQIGDENVHRVRAVMDEVFGDENLVAVISFKKSGAFDTNYLQSNFDHIVWFAKKQSELKFRSVPEVKDLSDEDLAFFDTVEVRPFDRRPKSEFGAATARELWKQGELLARNPLNSDGWIESLGYEFQFEGARYSVPKNRHWTTTEANMCRLSKAARLIRKGNTLRFVRYWKDYATQKRNNVWLDTAGGGFVGDARLYVVQTDTKVIQRCLLMATDPGDLVLDPTCGSGTTAYVAEQWGRRWITIDTSRVALALARARIMGARYPYYLLADSREGQLKEAELARSAPSSQPTRGSIAHGFVYERVPHITLKSIANNAEIDVIWEQYQQTLEPLRQQLNQVLGKTWEEWEITLEADAEWPDTAKQAHADWWQARVARQKEIDASIAAKADTEYLYDKPYEDRKKVRVAGPFTVESLSPHRMLGVDENGDIIDDHNRTAEPGADYGDGGEERDFTRMILENLKTAGVQQAHKEDRIAFTSLVPWPGELICAEGRYIEGDPESGKERRAAIFIGPEFGTVSRPDLVEAAREAGDADFDVLIACAFNYDAHSSEFEKLGRIPVLKARMNADLHMADDLKNTGKGNLFVIFGEPDIDILESGDGKLQVKVNGVDVFHPNTGEVRSDGPAGIACWFIDTDYNMESFFVRHAYFLGANDPYKALKTTLKAEIDAEAWATLNSDTSRPFEKPKSGRIAVKVINHLGDEVMKVFRVTA